MKSPEHRSGLFCVLATGSDWHFMAQSVVGLMLAAAFVFGLIDYLGGSNERLQIGPNIEIEC